MPAQHLVLIPFAPVEATLELAHYGAMYRALGFVAGERIFRVDFHPTYAAEMDRVVGAAVRGEDASVTASTSRGGLSSAGGVLNIHAEQLGESPERVSWTLGSEAAAKIAAWIQEWRG